MRVLLVEGALRENGGLRVSLDYARRWQRLGAQVTLAVVQEVADGQIARPDPSLTVRFLTPPGTRMRNTVPRALRRLVGEARRHDVVVCGSEEGNGLLFGYLAARLARRPFAVLVQADLDASIDTWVPGPLRRPTRWINRHADASICVADSVAETVLAGGQDAARVHVVLNGVDVEQIRELGGYRGNGDGAAAPDGRDRPRIVANGRLYQEKGFPTLLRAHAKVLADGHDHELLIIGEGPQRSELEALVAELGVRETVALPGFVDNNLADIARADAFVLSSETEGMPLTVMEALSLGTPVIATRCGIVASHLLGDGAYGDLVPVGGVDEMAAAMEAHLADPRRLRAKAVAGTDHVRKYDSHRSARVILDILAGLSRG